MNEKIHGFKGFDSDFCCLYHAFEVGKTYTHDGPVKVCVSGYHFCQNPLDVLKYYPPRPDSRNNRYAIVTASGKIDRHNEDSKSACETITIEKEIDLVTLAEHALKEKVPFSRGTIKTNTKKSVATENRGTRTIAASTGVNSAAVINEGFRAISANTGYNSVAITKNPSRLDAETVATTTGDNSAAINTNSYSAAISVGQVSTAETRGTCSLAACTSDISLASAKDADSVALVIGDNSSAEAGEGSIAIALTATSRARASHGGAIVLCYRERRNGPIIHIRASKVGENGIKPDTFYELDEFGNFVEATEE